MSDPQQTEPHAPVVDGYVLREVVGRGRTSTVWRAEAADGAVVAIKHIADPRWGVAHEPAPRRPIEHPHIVRSIETRALADGSRVEVWEYAAGGTLAGVVLARRRLSVGETVTVVTPIAEAVAALHAAGAFHGDISAGNVLLTAKGLPLLGDVTTVGMRGEADRWPMGTPGFIAPEVLDGAGREATSDLYALGALAWFCLTGSVPPETAASMDRDVLETHVGPEFANLIFQAVSAAPAERPAAADFAQAAFEVAPAEPLEVVIGGDPAAAVTRRIRAEAGRDRTSVPVAKDGAIARLLTMLARAGAWRPRLRVGVVRVFPGALRAVLVAVVAILCVGGGLVVATRGLAQPAPVAPGAPSAGVPLAVRAAGNGLLTSPATTKPAAGLAASETAAPQWDSPSARLALVQRLLDQRNRALINRDPTALAVVERAGTAVHRRDTGIVASLLKENLRYAGLRHEVVAVALAPGQRVEGARTTVTVLATIIEHPYQVIGLSGASVTRPGRPAQDLEVTLAYANGAWRIEAIRQAPLH